MTYAQLINGVWTDYGPDANGNAVTQNGLLSWQSFLSWPDTDKNNVGIFAVTDDTIPADKITTGSALSDRAGQPFRTFTLADAPPPENISDRQFAQQCAIEGVITQDESLAWVSTGTLPATLATLVTQLPTDQQFPAKMVLCGATSFLRHHPMVAIFAQMFSWTDAKLDSVWKAAAAL